MNKLRPLDDFLTALRGLDIDPVFLFRKSGLPPSLCISDNRMISTEKKFGLWHTVEEVSDEPAISLPTTHFIRLKETVVIHRSFQIGDHFVARNTDGAVIRGTIFDLDKEYYHVDWGVWGKKLVPVNWVESFKPWTLTRRFGQETMNED